LLLVVAIESKDALLFKQIEPCHINGPKRTDLFEFALAVTPDIRRRYGNSVIRRFESSRPSQLIYLIAIEFFTSRFSERFHSETAFRCLGRRHVSARLTPKSGHSAAQLACPLWAKPTNAP
jgi:hypothetical protein